MDNTLAATTSTNEGTLNSTASEVEETELKQEPLPQTTAKEATEEFSGYWVELDCGEEGIYDGIVAEVEPAVNASCVYGKIKLNKPSRNGVSLGTDQAVLIPGELVLDVKILMIPEPEVDENAKMAKKVVNRVAPIIRHNNKNTSIPKNTEQKGSPVTKKNTSTSKRTEEKGGLIQKKLINAVAAAGRRSVAQSLLDRSGIAKEKEKPIITIKKRPPQSSEIKQEKDNKPSITIKKRAPAPSGTAQEKDKPAITIKKRAPPPSTPTPSTEELKKKKKKKPKAPKVNKTGEEEPKTEGDTKSENKEIDEIVKRIEKIATTSTEQQQQQPEPSTDQAVPILGEPEPITTTTTSSVVAEEEKDSIGGGDRTTATASAAVSTDHYVGSLASIVCNESDDVYQGVISAVDMDKRTIELSKPMLNGLPLEVRIIELSSDIMKDIKIIRRGTVITSHEGGTRLEAQQQRNADQQPKNRSGIDSSAAGTVFMQSSPKPPRNTSSPNTSAEWKQQNDISSPMKSGSNNTEQKQHKSCGKKMMMMRAPSTPPAQLTYQTFGDYKKFTEPQTPSPMQIRLARNNPNRNLTNNSGNNGPTGIPEIDSLNGYRGRTNHQNDDTMGDPLDFETMNTDFDFAGNLALFNKAEFTRQTEQIFYGLDTACDKSRNFRNDENVLLDSTRVFSWTNNLSGGYAATNSNQQRKQSGTSSTTTTKSPSPKFSPSSARHY